MKIQTHFTALFILLPLNAFSGSITLQPETIAAWDAYLKAANAAMQDRLKPGSHFLWLDEDPDRTQSIRTKGPYIKPINPQIPQRVPAGLIHDWLGVSFVPSATIDDILKIVRDYARYKEVYRPGVVESAFWSSDGVKGAFSMRLAD